MNFRYMLLYVVRADEKGGGYSTLIDTDVLIRYMSSKTLNTLIHTEYEMKVPAEFFKGKKIHRTTLISGADMLFQYR